MWVGVAPRETDAKVGKSMKQHMMTASHRALRANVNACAQCGQIKTHPRLQMPLV